MSLEKTCHRDFRPVPTQTGLYSHRRWLGCGIRDLEGRPGLYYLCSDYKGVDQLRNAADLRLCFVHMQKADFFHDATHMMKLNSE